MPDVKWPPSAESVEKLVRDRLGGFRREDLLLVASLLASPQMSGARWRACAVEKIIALSLENNWVDPEIDPAGTATSD